MGIRQIIYLIRENIDKIVYLANRFLYNNLLKIRKIIV